MCSLFFSDVRQKLDELTRLFKDIQDSGHSRQRALDDTLGVAEKFWDDLNALNSTLKDLQDTLNAAEKPALEPEAIREQQEELEVRCQGGRLCESQPSPP